MVLYLPFICAGYLMRNMAKTQDAAIMANCLVYLEGTFLPAVFFLSIINSFKIKIPSILKKIVYFASFMHMVLVCTCSTNGLYYKSLKLYFGPYGSYLISESGPLKFLHYLYLLPIIIGSFYLVLYAFFQPERCSRRSVFNYFIILIFTSISYFVEIFAHFNYQILPIFYAIASWMVVFSYEQKYVHNIDDIIANMQDVGVYRGYVTFDLKKRFLCANELAYTILPDLKTIKLDKMIDLKKTPGLDFFSKMIEDFESGNPDYDFIKIGDRIYKCSVTYFYENRKESTKGFLFEISDDTDNRHYLEFVNNYNETLNKAIKSQTENIRAIQSKVVLGLADMIESRDENTGSHVKRTSDIINILVDVMTENGIGSINCILADDIIRAAPMHDLGKISIDNSILNKPARLTDEEFAVMRTHPVKSGEIVHAILKDVEESHFISVAYNIARYHHERWDGKGYPEGLSGEAIPLEARIMAVADVYDALVSERCYKEPMNFKQAYTVMMANMGTQFDPMMDTVFVLACPQLEAYYKGLK